MVGQARMIKELVTVCDGVRCLSSDEFASDDMYMCAPISYLSVECYSLLLSLFFI